MNNERENSVFVEKALELADEFTDGFDISEDSDTPCWIVVCGILAKEVRRLTKERDNLVSECRKALAASELVQRGDERFLLMPYSFINSRAFIEPDIGEINTGDRQ